MRIDTSLKISHLLNETNDTGATPFDYFLRDTSIQEMQTIMHLFLDNGAVPIQLAHIFLQKELEDDLDKEIKKEIYKDKRIIETDDKDKKKSYIQKKNTAE